MGISAPSSNAVVHLSSRVYSLNSLISDQPPAPDRPSPALDWSSSTPKRPSMPRSGPPPPRTNPPPLRTDPPRPRSVLSRPGLARQHELRQQGLRRPALKERLLLTVGYLLCDGVRLLQRTSPTGTIPQGAGVGGKGWVRHHGRLTMSPSVSISCSRRTYAIRTTGFRRYAIMDVPLPLGPPVSDPGFRGSHVRTPSYDVHLGPFRSGQAYSSVRPSFLCALVVNNHHNPQCSLYYPSSPYLPDYHYVGPPNPLGQIPPLHTRLWIVLSRHPRSIPSHGSVSCTLPGLRPSSHTQTSQTPRLLLTHAPLPLLLL